MHGNLCTSALVLLDKISMDTSTGLVRAIVGLLKTIRLSCNAKQHARLSLVLGVENNHMEEQEYETPLISSNLVTDWSPHQKAFDVILVA
jgi:hypothetical protein